MGRWVSEWVGGWVGKRLRMKTSCLKPSFTCERQELSHTLSPIFLRPDLINTTLLFRIRWEPERGGQRMGLGLRGYIFICV